MKQTVLRYGGYAFLFLAVFFILTWIFFGGATEKNFQAREVVGYLAIFLSTLFVFFGLKHYRDKVNGGLMSFGQGLKLGLLIVLFPSLAFALLNAIYVLVIDPSFVDTYYNYQVAQMKASTPAEKIAEELKEMEDQKKMFSNPVVGSFIMFITVFAIGLIVSVISALVLKRNQKPGLQ